MAIALKIDTNVRKVQAQIRKFSTQFPKSIDRAMRNAASDVQAELISRTPKRTGFAAGNYKRERIGNAAYRVTNNTFYIPFLEDGTGIFGPSGTPIFPKNAGFLQFRDVGRRGNRKLGIPGRRGSGKIIRKKFILGIRPYKMFATTVKVTPKIIRDNVIEVIRSIARRAGL